MIVNTRILAGKFLVSLGTLSEFHFTQSPPATPLITSVVTLKDKRRSLQIGTIFTFANKGPIASLDQLYHEGELVGDQQFETRFNELTSQWEYKPSPSTPAKQNTPPRASMVYTRHDIADGFSHKWTAEHISGMLLTRYLKHHLVQVGLTLEQANRFIAHKVSGDKKWGWYDLVTWIARRNLQNNLSPCWDVLERAYAAGNHNQQIQALQSHEGMKALFTLNKFLENKEKIDLALAVIR